MVEVDREEVEKALTPSCHHSVAGVVNVSPGIGTLSKAAVGQLIQHTLQGGGRGGSERGSGGGGGEWEVARLVGIFLTAHEDQVFQRVRESVIVVSLSSYDNTRARHT